MEESKVKTAEDLANERFPLIDGDDEQGNYNTYTRRNGFCIGYVLAQSHITKLEARNNELLILLEKVKELYVVRNRAGSYQEFYTVREQLEQAINKKL